jgi:hypothetical protein
MGILSISAVGTDDLHAAVSWTHGEAHDLTHTSRGAGGEVDALGVGWVAVTF